MRYPQYLFSSLLLCGSAVGSSFGQAPCDRSTDGFTVYGSEITTVHFSDSVLRTIPLVSAHGPDHDGAEAVFQGVLLNSFLQKAGVPSGASLRGRANQIYLRIEAKDGYAAVLALAETDSRCRRNVPIIAWSKNGAAVQQETQYLRGPVSTGHLRAEVGAKSESAQLQLSNKATLMSPLSQRIVMT